MTEGSDTIGAYSLSGKVATRNSDGSYVTKVRNSLITGGIEVKKHWDDESNRDGIRLGTLQIELTEMDSQNKRIYGLVDPVVYLISPTTATAEGLVNEATASQVYGKERIETGRAIHTGLPVYDKYGQKYKYYLIETDPSTESTAYLDAYTVTATKATDESATTAMSAAEAVNASSTKVFAASVDKTTVSTDTSPAAGEAAPVSSGAYVATTIEENQTTAFVITNSHTIGTTTLNVTKTWVDNNAYDDRPSSVDVILRAKYAEDDETTDVPVTQTWLAAQLKLSDMTDEEAATKANALVTNNGIDGTTGKATITPPATDSTSSTWTKSFAGLPTYLNGTQGCKITYYVTEDPIAGYDRMYNKVEEADDQTTPNVSEEAGTGVNAGNYTIKEGITNTQKQTELAVEKKWEGTDTFSIRDEVKETTFKVQRRIKTDDDTFTSWVDVPSSTSPTTITVSHTDGAATDVTQEALAQLPAYCSKGENYDKTYEYRAVEYQLTTDKGVTAEAVPTTDTTAADKDATGTISAWTYGTENAVVPKESTDAEDTFKTTVTNALITNKVEVTKAWDDESDRDGIRPGTIDATISGFDSERSGDITSALAANEKTKTIEVSSKSDDSAWSAAAAKIAWENLPVYDAAGNNVRYAVAESCSVADNKLAAYTATATRAEGSAEAANTTVYASTASKEATQANQTTLSSNIASPGSFVVTTIAKDATTALAFTNKHVLGKTELALTKNWSDNNIYGDRPTSVNVTLHATYTDGSGTSHNEPVTVAWLTGQGLSETETKAITTDTSTGASTVALTEGSTQGNATETASTTTSATWTRSWTGLPSYVEGAVGEQITYRVEETAPAGYTRSYDDASTTDVETTPVVKRSVNASDANGGTNYVLSESILNTYVNTELKVVKNWSENGSFNIRDEVGTTTYTVQRGVENADGAVSTWNDLKVVGNTKPVTITLNHTSTSTQDVTPATLSANPLVNLPTHNKSGEKYQYRAVESSLATTKSGLTATATQPETGTIGAWTYGLVNTSVAGTDNDSSTSDTTFESTITNTLITGTVSAQKQWVDEHNRDNARPATITFALSGTDSVRTGDVVPTLSKERTIEAIAPVAESGDTDTTTAIAQWEGLPVYDAAGTKIKYGIAEAGYTMAGSTAASGVVPGYEATSLSGIVLNASENTNAGFITNTHERGTTSLTATKVWDDQSNTYGDRPASVSVQIVATYGDADHAVNEAWLTGQGLTQAAATTILGTAEKTNLVITGSSTEDTWTKTWAGLPSYATGQVGQKITYTVVETEPVGYKLTYDDPSTSTVEASNTPVTSESVASTSNGGANRNVVETIVNTQLTTQLNVQKQWATPDPGKIADEVESATFKLQRRALKTSDEEQDGAWEDVPSVSTCTVNHGAATDSANAAWSALPTYDATGHAYEYRAIETGLTLKQKDGESKKEAERFVGITPANATTEGVIGGFDYTSTTSKVTEGSQTTAGYEFTSTITNTPRVGKLAVVKMWDDDSNRDGIRPGTLNVSLSAKVGTKDFALRATGTTDNPAPNTASSLGGNNTNEWYDAATWVSASTLPVFDAAGNTITYTLTETDNDGSAATVLEAYTAKVGSAVGETADVAMASAKAGTLANATTGTSVNASTTVSLTQNQVTAVVFKNTHELGTTSLTATKTWDDNNAYDDRPESLNLTLCATYDGQTKPVADALSALGLTEVPQPTKTTTTVGGKDAWVYTWRGLPSYLKDSVGKKITYTVQETVPYGYNGTYDVYGSGSSTPTQGSVPVNKEVAGMGSATGDFTVAEGITNTQIPTSLTIQKSWGDDQLHVRDSVASTTFVIERREATTVGEPTATTAYGGWEGLTTEGVTQSVARASGADTDADVVVSNLPKFSKDGKAYQYRAVEKSIALTSDAGGTTKDATVLDDSDNSMRQTGTVGGFAIESATTGNISAGFTTAVSNTPATGALVVFKTWDDNSDQDGIRPTSLVVTLTAAANENIVTIPQGIASVTLVANEPTHAASNDSAWTSLPLRDASGNEITYTIIESDGDNYEETILPAYAMTATVNGTSAEVIDKDVSTGLAQNATTTVALTNKHVPGTTTVDVIKTWEDQNNAYGDRPTEVIFELWKSTTTGDIAADGWTKVEGANVTMQLINGIWTEASWANLPSMENVNGVSTQIRYKAVELTPSGYSSEVTAHTRVVDHGKSDEANTSYAVFDHIKNTQTTTKLTVNKSWGADPDDVKSNVSKIVFELQRSTDNTTWETVAGNGATQEVARTAGTYTWNDLPTHNGEGKAYAYRAVETKLLLGSGGTPIEVSSPTDTSGSATQTGVLGGFQYKSETSYDATKGYTSTVTNGMVTTEFTGTKVWLDEDVAEHVTDAQKRVPLILARTTEGADSADTTYVPEWSTDGRTFTYKNLPACDLFGDAYTYSVRETGVNESGKATIGGHIYNVSYGVDEKGNTVITNTIADPTTLTITKAWDADVFGIHEDAAQATITVQRRAGTEDWETVFDDVTVAHVADATPDANNKVCETANDGRLIGLPAYRSTDGARYDYRAIETSVTLKSDDVVEVEPAKDEDGKDDVTQGTVGAWAYTAQHGYNDTDKRFEATTANALDTRTIAAKTVWDDVDDQDSIRPAELTVTLGAQVGGTAFALSEDGTQKAILSASNGWEATFAGLPVRDAAGNVLVYTLTESTADGATGIEDYTSAAQVGDDAATSFKAGEDAFAQTTLDKGAAVVTFTNAHTPPIIIAEHVTEDSASLGGTFVLEGIFAKDTERTAKTIVLNKGDGVPTKRLSGALNAESEESAYTVYVSDLVVGRAYDLRQTFVPSGYVRYPDYVLMRQESGNIVVSQKPTGATDEYSGADGGGYDVEDKFWLAGRGGTVLYDHRGDNQEYEHRIRLISVPLAPTVSKSDRATGTHLDDCRFMVTGDFVNGETQLVGLDNEVSDKMRGNVRMSDLTVTSLDGVTCAAAVEGGEWHPYTVKEVSEPAGYQIEPVSLDFVVNEYGTVYLTAESVQKALDSGTPASAIQGRAGESEGSGSGVVFSFSDPQTMVSIRKIGENGEALSGATFKLEGEHVVLDDNGLTTGKTSTDPMELAVDASGRIDLTGVLISSGTVLDADGKEQERTYTYTLSEVAAPDGYEGLSEPIVFTLSQTNELTLSQGADAATVSTEDGVAVLKVVNKRVQAKAATSGAIKTAGGTTSGVAGSVARTTVATRTPQTSDPTLLGLSVSLAVGGIAMILAGSRKRRD